MNRKNKSKYKQLTIELKMASNQLENDHELKEKVLKSLMLKHWEEFEFKNTNNNALDIFIFLYHKYEATFSKVQIEKLLKSVR